jgi:hypothetical protein|tara:strand:+ start:77 stop:289 length:213 start_codon:yes stop_codon:yes gene_type:complete
MIKIKKPQTLVKWGNEDVTMLEMFKELDKLVCDPVRNMQEMDGDMYMSDYQKLSQAFWRISNTLQELKDD